MANDNLDDNRTGTRYSSLVSQAISAPAWGAQFMANAAKSKPEKPYPSFPLTAHPNGQRCKKIRSKVHFFGVWADPQAALENYHAVAADLHAGRTPPLGKLSGTELSVKDACKAFLTRQKEKMEAGEIGSRWFEDCRTILKEFATTIGKSRAVLELQVTDFQRFRARLTK